jgi:hypothetical protein
MVRTSGEEAPGSEVNRIQWRAIRRRRDGGGEDQRSSGRKTIRPAVVRAQKAEEVRVQMASGRGTLSDAKSGRNVRSTVRPVSRLTSSAPGASGAPDARGVS